MPTEPLLSVEELSVSFHLDRGVIDAVRGVSFDIELGETLGLVGESGSGKSVTARSIMQLLPGTARLGKETAIRFKGERLDVQGERALQRLRGDRLGMIFQEPMTSLNPIFRASAGAPPSSGPARSSRKCASPRMPSAWTNIRTSSPADSGSAS